MCPLVRVRSWESSAERRGETFSSMRTSANGMLTLAKAGKVSFRHRTGIVETLHRTGLFALESVARKSSFLGLTQDNGSCGDIYKAWAATDQRGSEA
ncbi:multidrug resistance-associated ABC transporter [Pseudozyma hubeiensis SY62]|uniref:Multidrug resistance-associated ABC transporter n=1 Tax=Pseudozyma hubeiensis (strain SY62) TaxID=1305764 RepID=R9P9S5_PSEHS|nr:multidrug resistance-associated ABC transporter [Pseudozyma hubeiensis SY62]GAC98126.1 multidrug resistance-associated ABC transporter [Pseudozyma hubeiensis SY62]